MGRILNSHNILHSSSDFLSPSHTAVVRMPAVLSGIISGIAENKCIALVQQNAEKINRKEGSDPVMWLNAKNPGIAYKIFEEKSKTILDLNRMGGAL